VCRHYKRVCVVCSHNCLIVSDEHGYGHPRGLAGTGGVGAGVGDKVPPFSKPVTLTVGLRVLAGIYVVGRSRVLVGLSLIYLVGRS
jgi:hypothetical protein